LRRLEFKAAVEAVVKACRKHNKALGRLVPTVEDAVAYRALGFDFLCYSGDVWALQGAVQAGLEQIRARTATQGAGKGKGKSRSKTAKKSKK
jgi:2-dehydro-3-deoxyglucarate aldolase/4-hydroxy-2-oxoheptanedioate aldolase